MRPDPPPATSLPWRQVAGALALALGLWLLPDELWATWRGRAHDLLVPGQRLWTLALDRLSKAPGADPNHSRGSGAETLANQLRDWQAREAVWRHELRELARELARRGPAGLPIAVTTPALVGDVVPARRLGWQARGAGVPRELVDLGTAAGVTAGAMVLAPAADDPAGSDPPQVDIGTAQGVAAGELVLADRRVWGRLRDVGRQTSTVERVTDPRFRQVVAVASAETGELEAPVALWEGTGAPRARLRGVPVTAAVGAGDLVLAHADSGGGELWWYGTVARAERHPESAEWQLWVEPAAFAAAPGQLWVWRWRAGRTDGPVASLARENPPMPSEEPRR